MDITIEEVIKLYYRYRSSDDQKIQNFLDHVKLIKFTNKGSGTIQGYYELCGESVESLKNKPKTKSLTFDLFDNYHIGELQSNLVFHSKLKFLVKSSSRFFYKPDIGEVVDQIHFTEIGSIKAVNIDCSNYIPLPNTEGEHFICTVELFTNGS